MIEQQIIEIGIFGLSFFTAGFVTCLAGFKRKEKKERQRAKIQELFELQDGFIQETKESVWEDLAEARKRSISDNDWGASCVR